MRITQRNLLILGVILLGVAGINLGAGEFTATWIGSADGEWTDAANWDDKTCIVEPTEHPGWLTKQSCVAFQYAIVTSLKNLKQGETAGVYFKRSHVPKELLEKIINALQNADELKNAVKVVLTRQGLMS